MSVTYKPKPKTFVEKLLGNTGSLEFFENYSVEYQEPQQKLFVTNKAKTKTLCALHLPADHLKKIAWGGTQPWISSTVMTEYKAFFIELLASAKAAQPAPTAEATPAPASKASGWNECDVAAMKGLPLVPLMAANRILQPVKGTSEGSRYFFIGEYANGVRMAIKHDKPTNGLSIRLEGPGLIGMQKAWALAGLNWDGGKGGKYQSVHMSCGNTVEVVKAIASVMFALGTELKTPAPNLQKVVTL